MSVAMNQTDVRHPDTGGPAANGRWSQWIRLASAVITILALLAIARLLPMGRIVDFLGAAVQDMGIWGPLVFAAVYVVATVLMLPGAALTLAAGAIFGLVWGTVAVSAGSTTGAALAFLIGRYLARDTVERRLGRFPKFRAVDRAVSEGGWKIVALLRLSPAIPFNLQNYLYGLTAIRFWPCVIASWIAMLPGTFMYVYLGYAGRAGVAAAAGESAGRSPAQWAMLGVGLLATIAVTVYVTKLARRAIARQSGAAEELAEADQPQEDHPVTPKPARRMVTAAYAAVALSVVVLAGCAYANQSWVRGLFGPPEAKLAEAYAENPSGPSFDHSDFDKLLKQYVNDAGGVDYAGLMPERQTLQTYISRIADAPFDKLGRDEKLALLINAYNAFTLELILEHWNNGQLDSIKDIRNQWTDQRWTIAGQTYSLNQIEHEQIRPKFKEPRIHWAVVCAAVGCPPLRSEAFVAGQLDEQLADQARYVHTHDKWYRYDQPANAVHLTQLYNWYGGDFEQVAGSVLAYAAQYDPGLKQALDAGQPPRIKWLDYDWSLNSQENVK